MFIIWRKSVKIVRQTVSDSQLTRYRGIRERGCCAPCMTKAMRRTRCGVRGTVEWRKREGAASETKRQRGSYSRERRRRERVDWHKMAVKLEPVSI